jgi:hypothetical protein
MQDKLNSLNYTIIIDAPVIKVWDTMLELPTYQEWTSEFEPTSTYQGSWDQGAVIKFLSSDWGGMVGFIKENIEYQFVSIEYTGVLKNGEIDESNPTNEIIKGAHENYTFMALNDNQTQLDISTETTFEWSEYLQTTWPKALAKLKTICES